MLKQELKMDSVVISSNSVGYNSLAYEGGGAKGFVFVGATQELERLGILPEIDKIAGSSVGAIAALYVASGYTVQQLKDKMFNLDFKSLLMGEHYIEIPINWVNKFGLFDADKMHQHFRDIIKEITGSEKTTFAQWHEFKLKHPEKKLKDIIVEACNISTGFNETFSYESEHKDEPIAEAVGASMAFPQVFAPVKIGKSYYSDGGMQNNCPISVFGNKSGVVGKEVLGICLEDLANIHYFLKGEKPTPKEINNVFECLESQIEAMLNVQSYNLMTGPYKNQIIYCDTLEVGTLNFGLTLAEKEALVASGQYGVMRYVALNHPELAKLHYPAETLALLQKAEYPLSITEFVAFVKKNCKQDIRKALKASDMLHIHWASMPALSKAGGCGNRRIQSDSHVPVQVVTPTFDRFRQAANTNQQQAANDEVKPNVEQKTNQGMGCTLF